MSEQQAHIALPLYQSHKRVWALKIKSITPSKPTVADLEAILQSEEDVPVEVLPDGSISAAGMEKEAGATIEPEDNRYSSFVVSREYMRKHNPQPGGYWVRYEDGGYESWSPADVFERGNIPVHGGIPGNFSVGMTPAEEREQQGTLGLYLRIDKNEESPTVYLHQSGMTIILTTDQAQRLALRIGWLPGASIHRVYRERDEKRAEQLQECQRKFEVLAGAIRKLPPETAQIVFFEVQERGLDDFVKFLRQGMVAYQVPAGNYTIGQEITLGEPKTGE